MQTLELMRRDLVTKYFTIGFNKTATRQIAQIYKYNGLRSQHRRRWNLEAYDAFSDGNHSDKYFIRYFEWYPDAMCILNTRPLIDWLKSRYKHRNTEFLVAGKPRPAVTHISDKLTGSWIRMRNQHYRDVLDYFQDKRRQLLIVDVSKFGWIEFFCDRLSFDCPRVNLNRLPNALPDCEMNESVMHTINQHLVPYGGVPDCLDTDPRVRLHVSNLKL